MVLGGVVFYFNLFGWECVCAPLAARLSASLMRQRRQPEAALQSAESALRRHRLLWPGSSGALILRPRKLVTAARADGPAQRRTTDRRDTSVGMKRSEGKGAEMREVRRGGGAKPPPAAKQEAAGEPRILGTMRWEKMSVR